MFRRFRDEDDAAVDAALSALDLMDLQKRQIRELSGGQQQRTFLARALAQEAHVLLLDEPFTGLDRNASKQLGDLLAKLSHEGRLVIASHHDLATAPKLFDEALLLKTRPIAFGAAAEALGETNIDLAFGHISDREERAAPQPATVASL